jgi:hypothetical protein
VEIDKSVWGPMGVYTFRIKGTLCHKIGSLLPEDGEEPKYAQIYIMDSSLSQQIQQRLKYGHGYLDEGILQDLTTMMHNINPYYNIYKSAKERIGQDENLCLNLTSFDATKQDPRCYNLPTAAEVGVIMNKDLSNVNAARDLIIEYRTGRLKRISELHAAYLPLRFPLLYPYGEPGWHREIPFAHVVWQSESDKRVQGQQEENEELEPNDSGPCGKNYT